MLFERRFFSGLITGGLLGVLAGVMLLPRRPEEEERLTAARRITGWLKK